MSFEIGTAGRERRETAEHLFQITGALFFLTEVARDSLANLFGQALAGAVTKLTELAMLVVLKLDLCARHYSILVNHDVKSRGETEYEVVLVQFGGLVILKSIH